MKTQNWKWVGHEGKSNGNFLFTQNVVEHTNDTCFEYINIRCGLLFAQIHVVHTLFGWFLLSTDNVN